MAVGGLGIFAVGRIAGLVTGSSMTPIPGRFAGVRPAGRRGSCCIGSAGLRSRSLAVRRLLAIAWTALRIVMNEKCVLL